MKNPYEIFKIDTEFDLDYLINTYEELISNCNDKEEIEEIQNAYEKLLGILNQSKTILLIIKIVTIVILS